jgi:phosphatidylglycerol:prolipoprotein diacylglycerol transferase
MPGPFVHHIDPVITEVAGVYLWWYGLCYTFGFLAIHLWLRHVRRRLGLSIAEVYDLSLLIALGVLLGGRTVEVFFYEWPYYGQHPEHIPFVWLGGMSTHGVLLGGAAGTWLFCRLHRKDFLSVGDELVIPGAFLMGVGRVGNFIDGQIVGRVTDVGWAVQFPDADDFRHPVVLYDGAKNLLLIPLLLLVRHSRPPRGVVTAHFILWYGFLRLFVDYFRQYPTRLLGIPTGQIFNGVMALLGACLLLWCYRASRAVPTTPAAVQAQSPPQPATRPAVWARRLAFVFLLLFSLLLPGDWTQDVPSHYGKRHPGMRHSFWYPPINP